MPSLFLKIKEVWERITGRRDTEKEKDTKPEEWINPYISESRNIIEQILHQKGLDFRRFRPVLLDTDCPGQQFGEADDVDRILDQLEDGLNFLEICTDRPEYFAGRKNRLEQEYGLMVRILSRNGREKRYGNMVLDLERHQPMRIREYDQDVIYLPFYKRKWKPVKAENSEFSGEENLDIEVPIGYNMMIVKVDKKILRQGM